MVGRIFLIFQIFFLCRSGFFYRFFAKSRKIGTKISSKFLRFFFFVGLENFRENSRKFWSKFSPKFGENLGPENPADFQGKIFLTEKFLFPILLRKIGDSHVKFGWPRPGPRSRGCSGLVGLGQTWHESREFSLRENFENNFFRKLFYLNFRKRKLGLCLSCFGPGRRP